jgi:hypothetical protein
VLRKLGQLFVILALITAIGGHWAALQTIAWTTMLANNLRDCSFAEAVEKTFDGQHPCKLCKQISAGKKAEKKSEFQVDLKKFEFTHASSEFVFGAPSAFWLQGESVFGCELLHQSPPLPPPRSSV